MPRLLVHHDLPPVLLVGQPDLVSQLAKRPWIRDLAMTTNGVLLADAAHELKRAGLHRLTVSLDTLKRDRFHTLARVDALDKVLAGIDAARRAGFAGLKLDAVVMRDVNDDEIVDLLEFGRTIDAEVRFIEYMDVGGATNWRPEFVVSRREMLLRVERAYGAITAIDEDSSAPAARFRPHGGVHQRVRLQLPAQPDQQRRHGRGTRVWNL
jgi:cyclic pyranopterin phosphate synthase